MVPAAAPAPDQRHRPSKTSLLPSCTCPNLQVPSPAPDFSLCQRVAGGGHLARQCLRESGTSLLLIMAFTMRFKLRQMHRPGACGRQRQSSSGKGASSARTADHLLAGRQLLLLLLLCLSVNMSNPPVDRRYQRHSTCLRPASSFFLWVWSVAAWSRIWSLSCTASGERTDRKAGYRTHASLRTRCCFLAGRRSRQGSSAGMLAGVQAPYCAQASTAADAPRPGLLHCDWQLQVSCTWLMFSHFSNASCSRKSMQPCNAR